MKAKMFFLILCTAPLLVQSQVTVQKGAVLFIQDNATINVQGDVEAAEDIGGNGSIILNGNTAQSIGLYGNAVPSLIIDNTNGVTLSSELKVNRHLALQKGHLVLGRYDVELGHEAAAAGNENAYLVTNGSGRVIKHVAHDLHTFIVPVGTASRFAPLILKSSGKYSAASVTISASSAVHPNKPASSRDYLHDYWTINRRGVTGELVATAFYSEVTGQEQNLRPFLWNGHQWATRETTVDTRNKLLSVDVPDGRGEIYAMRKGDELEPAASSIVLFPNPVHNMATLVIRTPVDENIVLRIVNNAGATVIVQRVNLRQGVNQVNINVSSLANGQYLITSTQKNGKSVTMIKRP